MVKKATRKLYKKYNKHQNSFKLKGSKVKNVKTGNAYQNKKDSISLAKVLERKTGNRGQKRKKKHQEVDMKRVKLENLQKTDENKDSVSDLKSMNLDDLLKSGLDFQIEDSEVDSKNNNTSTDNTDLFHDIPNINHKEELAQLQSVDPEFFAFLKESNSEVLSFNGPAKKEKVDLKLKIISDAYFKKLLNSMEKASLKSTLKFCVIFESAVNFLYRKNTGDQKRQKKHSWSRNLIIVDDYVAKNIVKETLSCMPKSLVNFVTSIKKTSGKQRADTKQIVRLLLENIAKLVLLEESIEVKLEYLNQAKNFTPFFAHSYIYGEAHSSRIFLKTIITVWASCDDEEVSTEIIRILKEYVFKCYEMTAQGKHLSKKRTRCNDVYKLILAKCYSAFLSSLKRNVSEKRLGQLSSFYSEIAGISYRISYQVGFVCLRQLSLVVRTALLAPSAKNEYLVKIYGKKHIQPLKFWTLVLSNNSGNLHPFIENISEEIVPQVSEKNTENVAKKRNSDSDSVQALKPLVYPLVQIIDSTISLSNSAEYFPLRLILIKLLLHLGSKCKQFIPIDRFVMTIFRPSLLKNKGSGEMFPVDVDVALKLTPAQVKSPTVINLVVDKTLSLISAYVEMNRYAYCFPEIMNLMLLLLKKTAKISSHLKSKVKSVIELIIQYSKITKLRRKERKLNPMDLSDIMLFKSSKEANRLAQSVTDFCKQHPIFLSKDMIVNVEEVKELVAVDLDDEVEVKAKAKSSTEGDEVYAFEIPE